MEGGGGGLAMRSDRVPRESWKGLSQGLGVGQGGDGSVWLDLKVIKHRD